MHSKLIGARYYDLSSVRGPAPSGGGSPRDDVGHGTHTSSTAAGSAVTGASYYGLAPGTAKGGSAASRVAMYRVCSQSGCAGSAILAGFDDAIADGVDVISVSLGASPYFRPDFSADPIAIGSFHAVAKGVTVVCSAGNSGPGAATVVNAAPWILTVAATTIDRDFESDVLLGGNNSAVKVRRRRVLLSGWYTVFALRAAFDSVSAYIAYDDDVCICAGCSYKLLEPGQIPQVSIDHRRSGEVQLSF
jgi:subtilisin family serine protease